MADQHLGLPLSAEELMTIRVAKTKPKPLPSATPKEFSPFFSNRETEEIDSMINEQLALVQEERAERKNLLSKAVWIPEKGLAIVEIKTGSCWGSYGFHSNGQFYLYPEEVLFLLDTMKVELWYGEGPVSVQQAFVLLLQPQYCSFDKYNVYSHLSRQGYRIKHRLVNSGTRKRVAKVDLAPSSSKKLRGNSISVHFQQTAADKSDLACIPDFADKEIVQLKFEDPSLIPETCRNRLSIYTQQCPNRTQHPVNFQPSSLKKTRNWEEFKLMSVCEMDAAPSDNTLFHGKTKPLLSMGANLKLDEVLSRLRIFSKATLPEPQDTDINELQISYDVYSPGSAFRKSSPGTPNMSVAITDWNAPFPSSSALQRLASQCGSETTLLVAVTRQGSDVAFYQLGNLHSLGNTRTSTFVEPL